LIAGVVYFRGATLVAAPAAGPLRVHPHNPRYFTDGAQLRDGSLRVVYVTGAHTWNNLLDMGRNDPPDTFDYEGYLDFLERHHHNFIRLWAWDSTVWDTRANGRLGKDYIHHVAPLPWIRTGPDNAIDGKPRFDLAKFDRKYFERLRARVKAAGDRGIYVSVMLFEGWGLMHANQGRAAPNGWAWRSHPFHPSNNINELGLDAVKPEAHRLGNAKTNDLQAAYIRKVVDAVDDLDNVLYEVINEGGQKDWNRWVIQTIRDHEAKKAKQHPIGTTGHGAERLGDMVASSADWVSPGRVDGFGENPPAWPDKYRKVSIIDTDHIWGVGGNGAWVWKSFCRGHNPIFMDPYDGAILGKPGDKQWEPIYRALGDTRRFAARMNLAQMSPHDELASTKYCLAAPGAEYLVYVPDGRSVSVNLSAAKQDLVVEWFDPVQQRTIVANPTPGGDKREFKAPFKGPAVLYLMTPMSTAAARD
jgi:hypothetical protein